MRLTAYTDYSLRVLIRLALAPDELATIAEIAAVYDISEHHLMKVVHELGRAGYVETLRGRGGGLRLARRPAQINVGEVVRRMEPDFALAACFRESEHCAIESSCSLNRVLDQALGAFMQVLNDYTIADLVKKPKALAALLSPVRPPARIKGTH